MPHRPNLLMVCYFYPPAATGVRRALSLVRHLPTFGWRPFVLACPLSRGAGFDPAPLEEPAVAAAPHELAESLDPHRLLERFRPTAGASRGQAPAAKSSGRGARVMQFLRRHVLVPDDRVGWLPFAVLRGIALVRRHRLLAVYSSNYPQSAHLVAGLIARATGVPWLADFRDGWTQNPAFFDPGNPLAAALSRAGERFVARNAARIVTVSPPITRHLQALRPPGLAPAVTIYNGFEPEECPGESGECASPLHAGRLTLLYTGTFFGRRRPDLFLHALARVVRRDPRWRERLVVRLRCALDARERALVERLGVAEVVEVLPPVPFRDCLVEQSRADAFLLVLEHGPGSGIMVSQKVFEYLAARRPILALVPEGAAAELLADVGGATTCTSRRPGDAARALGAFLGALESGTHPLANPERLATYARREQARAMAAELSAMAPRPRGSRRSASH